MRTFQRATLLSASLSSQAKEASESTSITSYILLPAQGPTFRGWAVESGPIFVYLLTHLYEYHLRTRLHPPSLAVALVRTLRTLVHCYS